MVDSLPDNLLVVILSLLPVKSILRSRCVCKSWNDLIKSPFLISTHLIRSAIDYASQSSSLLERITPTYRSEIRYLNRFPYKSYPCYNVHGFCDGLICLSVNSVTHILWNPAIRKSITIPDIRFSESIGSSYEPLGFGYDSLRKDYKVIKINYHPIRNVEIFSLKTKTWKISNPDFTDYSINYDHNGMPQIFMNGFVHWVACDSSKDMNLYENAGILSFDLSKEEFRVIMLPELSKGPNSWDMHLFMESLGIVVYEKKGDDKFLDIWVMKEYGICSSWMKAFSIDKSVFVVGFPIQRWFSSCYVFGFLKNGDILGYLPGQGTSFWIDHRNKKVMDTNLECGIESDYFIHRSYGESLLLLDEPI